jgi:hypothetical protein
VSQGLQEQGEGLGRLVWIYLRLLLTRESIRKILREASKTQEESVQMETRIGKIEEQLKDSSISEDLKKSLSGQVEILRQRLEKKHEAAEKLVFLDAELTRIEQQVELLREQVVLSTDPETVSQRIDQVTATLGGTNQWIRDQQKFTARWRIFSQILHRSLFPDRRNLNEPTPTRMGRTDERSVPIRIGRPVSHSRKHIRRRADRRRVGQADALRKVVSRIGHVCSYDVVLEYDRGRGIRLLKGGDDWGEWLKQAVGDQASTTLQTREPGVALELIDRYLLRTLNLQSIRGREAPPAKLP